MNERIGVVSKLVVNNVDSYYDMDNYEYVYKFKCPKCEYELIVETTGLDVCACGIRWTVIITATGVGK